MRQWSPTREGFPFASMYEASHILGISRHTHWKRVPQDTCTLWWSITERRQLLPLPCLNHTTRVVLTLTQPLYNQGYDVYTDRFYTSPLLALELEKVGTTLTGTVVSNRKGLPYAVREKRRRVRGETHTYRKGSMVCMEWTDKRTVIALSTKHSNRMVDVPSR